MAKQMLVLLVAVSFVIGACSTHRANFSYSEFKMDMPIKAGPFDGQELGAVEGSQGGFVWTSCNEQARDAVQDLIANTKAKGGNAVGNVRWRATGQSDPACKKSWGFVLVWPFLFTPLFASSHVDGTAYKTSGGKAGLYMLPTNKAEEEAFIAAILAQAN